VPKRVQGKVAIVTGAGSVGPGMGNGKASAILYAREGAQVVLADYNKDAAEETKYLIDEEGGECTVFQGDVSNAHDCKNLVDHCIDLYGRIDVLHNNVGIEIPGGLDEISEDAWDKTLNVNLKSMFLLCKYSIPHMVRQGGGSIINISSINAIRTLPTLSVPYGVSKAGVIALTREIAVQYAPSGIRVNAILPGLMNTPLVKMSLTDSYGGDVQDMIDKRDVMCPMKRQGDAWDTAYLALFLASDEASYITGALMVVDGGLTCKAGY